MKPFAHISVFNKCLKNGNTGIAILMPVWRLLPWGYFNSSYSCPSAPIRLRAFHGQAQFMEAEDLSFHGKIRRERTSWHSISLLRPSITKINLSCVRKSKRTEKIGKWQQFFRVPMQQLLYWSRKLNSLPAGFFKTPKTARCIHRPASHVRRWRRWSFGWLTLWRKTNVGRKAKITNYDN